VTRSFDQNGNVASWTDQNGSVVTNLYDEENRLYQRSISKGTGVGGVTLETFGHDALGRVLTAINNDTKVLLDWDSVGNLLSDQQGYNISGSEQYKTPSATWSIAGAMTGLSYPAGLSISHARDAIHRLTGITDVGTSATILDVDWQGLGRKAKATNENGTVTEYAYDGFRRLAEIDHRLSSSGGSFHTLEYAYDDVHNRRMERHSFDATWVSGLPSAVQSFLNARDTKGDVYGYDWAYRMVTAKYDVTNPASEVATPNSQTYVTMTAYTLDGLGNRSQVGVTPYGGSTSTTTYASDVVNQYTSIASVSRTHDHNGNLTDDGNQEYVYDYANHLIEVKDSSSSTVATYMYDALGRRVEKDVAGGAVTRYILWGVSIIEEVNGSGTWQASYVQTDRIDFPCAMDRADVADVDGDTNTSEILRFHFHQQALGSVTEVSEPGGAIVEWVTYDVYGAATVRDQGGTVVGSSAVGNPFLFTGREFDVESGLYHYRARAYDPEAGRFLQRDPLGPQDGANLHEFVGSHPTQSRDPHGESEEPVDDPREQGVAMSEYERLVEEWNALVEQADLLASEPWNHRGKEEVFGADGEVVGNRVIDEEFQRLDGLIRSARKWYEAAGGKRKLPVGSIDIPRLRIPAPPDHDTNPEPAPAPGGGPVTPRPEDTGPPPYWRQPYGPMPFGGGGSLPFGPPLPPGSQSPFGLPSYPVAPVPYVGPLPPDGDPYSPFGPRPGWGPVEAPGEVGPPCGPLRGPAGRPLFPERPRRPGLVPPRPR
jgi:RHS repeat-associated protein